MLNGTVVKLYTYVWRRRRGNNC